MKPITLFLALVFFTLSNSNAQVKTSKAKKSNTSIYKSLSLKPTPKNYIKVVYEKTEDSSYMEWYNTFKEQKFLEQMAGTINKVFKIKKTFTLSLRDCGVVNAFYSSQKKELTLCYDMLHYLFNFYKDSIPDADELGSKIGKALTFIYFHEVGHALIDILDIPITGKEEDAADYFSFYFLASNEVPEGVEATMEGANFFLESYNRMITDTAYVRLKSEGKEPELPFWDEHSLDMQRFYSIACLIYGSNPEKYDHFIEKGLLGGRRPGIAISEFKKIKKGWDRLLGPHIKYVN
jgi:Putative metallopeptidase